MIDLIIFLVHVSSTLIMFGIIWFVQLAHYPLLGYIGRKEFVGYEKAYVQKIMPYAILVLSAELITGILLVWIKPLNISFVQVLSGLILLAVIWLSTWVIQVPLHKKLGFGFDKKSHDLLVKSNWVRTGAWTLRAFLVIWMLMGFIVYK